MQPSNALVTGLSNIQLEHGVSAGDAIENGSVVALRINQQAQQVTFYYLDGVNKPFI